MVLAVLLEGDAEGLVDVRPIFEVDLLLELLLRGGADVGRQAQDLVIPRGPVDLARHQVPVPGAELRGGDDPLVALLARAERGLTHALLPREREEVADGLHELHVLGREGLTPGAREAERAEDAPIARDERVRHVGAEADGAGERGARVNADAGAIGGEGLAGRGDHLAEGVALRKRGGGGSERFGDADALDEAQAALGGEAVSEADVCVEVLADLLEDLLGEQPLIGLALQDPARDRDE